MWDTRGHWNMKMKGKKKEKRIETVTMDALPFNGCSPLFFFVEISKTTICLLCIVSNQNEERNIECWLEKYFTVNISFVKRYYRIRISKNYFISPQFFRCTILWKGWFNEIYSSFWESYRWRVKIYFREKLTF